jgi:hypothetical protein
VKGKNKGEWLEDIIAKVEDIAEGEKSGVFEDMDDSKQDNLLDEHSEYVKKTIGHEKGGLVEDIDEAQKDLTEEIDRRIGEIGSSHDHRVIEYNSLKSRMKSKFQDVKNEIEAEYNILKENTIDQLKRLDLNSRSFEQDMESNLDLFDESCNEKNEKYFDFTSDIITSIGLKIENIHESTVEKNLADSPIKMERKRDKSFSKTF